MPKYVKYAKKACDVATRCNSPEEYDYLIMYSSALCETNQYEKAYEIIQSAEDSFNKIVPNGTPRNTKEDIAKIMIKGNYAEISLNQLKSSVIFDNNKSEDICKKAQDIMTDILHSIKGKKYNNTFYYQLFDTAWKVFSLLREYYSQNI